MRFTVIGLGLALVLGTALIGRAADPPASSATTIDVWPGPAPGENGSIGEEKATRKEGSNVITSLTNVTKPTLTVSRPESDKNTGAAVLVFPGGGYTNLAWDHEGEQVARWLNSIGVTAAILKYRVPRRPDTPKGQPPVQALMDAQRAISIVRSKAADWGVDPKRIGILGFSAGGHLSTWAATNAEKLSYEPVDESDKASARPDFAVVIYPGGVYKSGTDQIASEIRVTSQTPPTFIVQSSNDNPENSVFLYLALKRAGVPAEMHLYATGGHGYGLRPSNQPRSSWPQRCEDWLRDIGVLKTKT